MSLPNLTPNGNKAFVWYGLAVLAIVIDQVTKLYFENNFQLYQTLPLIDPILNFTLAHNHGAAFSFLADKGGWQKWFFSALALAVSVGIMVYLRKTPQQAKVLSFGLAMVLSGALGNLIDRVRLGYVIDFVHVHYADVWHFPIFNVADMAINLGVALILIDAFFLEPKRTARV
ncbi:MULTISPECIES: signal peptidase II [unclassified Moraxella]|uniref:signal peptidase II n=1 Tax=unclassified Moraxella TaxID=2685852 RepID=UPI003AF771CB